MSVTEQNVLDALRTVKDPDLFKDLVTLNQIKNVKILEAERGDRNLHSLAAQRSASAA